MKRLFTCSVLVLLVCLIVTGCSSQKAGETTTLKKPDSFKASQIRLIITHGAGGSVDVAGRGIAPFLEKYLGVPVQPENMEGAGGRRAMEYVFNDAPKDGSVIVVSAFPSRLLGELITPGARYKMKDFVHLGAWNGGDYRSVIVAAKSSYQSFKDLVEASKQKKLKGVGGGGVGSSSQLQTIFLTKTIGLNAEYVPTEATAEVASYVLGGHTDFGVMPLSAALRFQEQGDVRILAIHAAERSDYCPDVPTMKELGYEGVELDSGNGAWAPPGTPDEIAKFLADGIALSVKDPKFQEWVKQNKIMFRYLGPKEFLEETMNEYKQFEPMLPLIKGE